MTCKKMQMQNLPGYLSNFSRFPFLLVPANAVPAGPRCNVCNRFMNVVAIAFDAAHVWGVVRIVFVSLVRP